MRAKTFRVPHFFQLQPWIHRQNLLQQSLRKLQKISSVRCLSRRNPVLTGNVHNPVFFQIQIKMSKKMQQLFLPQMKQRGTGPHPIVPLLRPVILNIGANDLSRKHPANLPAEITGWFQRRHPISQTLETAGIAPTATSHIENPRPFL